MYLCSPKFEIPIEIWCNGSTTDSGSVSEGSNPSISTILQPGAVAPGFLCQRALKACFHKRYLAQKSKVGEADGAAKFASPPQAARIALAQRAESFQSAGSDGEVAQLVRASDS